MAAHAGHTPRHEQDRIPEIEISDLAPRRDPTDALSKLEGSTGHGGTPEAHLFVAWLWNSHFAGLDDIAETRIVCVAGGEEAFDFLGFQHRMVPTRKNPNRRYPACWPSDKKMAQARSRIQELTGRNRRHVSTAVLVEDLNQYLRGWRQYYRFGNSTHRFAKIDRYVVDRMALLLSKRHGRRGRGYGLKLIIFSGDRLGLERLTGTIVYGRTAHAGGEGRRRAG